MGLVLLVILFLEVLHVFTHVSTKDAFTVHVRIVLLRITVITRESLLGVGNVQTTVGGTLEGTKDTATRGGRLAAHIEEAAERSLVFIDFIDVVSLLVNFGLDHFAVNLGVSFVGLIETQLLEETTGHQETGAVGSGVVLQTNGQAVTRKFLGGGLAEDTVTIDQGIHNLADDLTIGESDHQSVLGRLVLVLVLADETLALTVVRDTFAATTELDLVA